MSNILEYYVMRTERGITIWLDGDETTWTTHFHNAACFTDVKLAYDIGKRETLKDQTFYVMACMGSI
jgi:hypothetical protein